MTQWQGFPDDGRATAPNTGPFPFAPFLKTVWRHRDDRDADLRTAVSAHGAVALAVTDRHVGFAGQENLTDYHSPIGAEPVAILVEALDGLSGRTFRFDSLPGEAATAVEEAVRKLGAEPTVTEHEMAAVLTLPQSFDDWLMGIGKKERHEVRRKRRRFEGEFGPIEVVRAGVEQLEDFCVMHRTAPGDKGAFMTTAMEAYFADLLTDADGVIHLLICDGRPLAAAFGFETDDGYYYYNSAFEPDAAHASPGVVLFSTMIANQIERGAAVFDFLKGDETYKFRHGAEPRQLYLVEGTLP